MCNYCMDSELRVSFTTHFDCQKDCSISNVFYSHHANWSRQNLEVAISSSILNSILSSILWLFIRPLASKSNKEFSDFFLWKSNCFADLSITFSALLLFSISLIVLRFASYNEVLKFWSNRTLLRCMKPILLTRFEIV